MLNWKTDHRHCFTCELEKPLFASRRLALSDKICWCLMWESTRVDKKGEKQPPDVSFTANASVFWTRLSEMPISLFLEEMVEIRVSFTLFLK